MVSRQWELAQHVKAVAAQRTSERAGDGGFHTNRWFSALGNW